MNPIYVIVALLVVVVTPALVKEYRHYRLRQQVMKNLQQVRDRSIWIERAYREYDGR